MTLVGFSSVNSRFFPHCSALDGRRPAGAFSKKRIVSSSSSQVRIFLMPSRSEEDEKETRVFGIGDSKALFVWNNNIKYSLVFSRRFPLFHNNDKPLRVRGEPGEVGRRGSCVVPSGIRPNPLRESSQWSRLRLRVASPRSRRTGCPRYEIVRNLLTPLPLPS